MTRSLTGPRRTGPPPADRDGALPPRLPLPRRVLGHPRVMHHHRLVLVVLLANLVPLASLLDRGGWTAPDPGLLSATSYLALANIALAVLVRQQYVVNLLFRLATRAPVHWPLRVRWTLGKVYHFGGLHIGGALAGTGWFLAYVALLTAHLIRRPDSPLLGTLLLSYVLLGLLLAVGATARPEFRARHHDLFERVHRFGGWTALALLWAQTVASVLAQRGDTPAATALAATPGVWVLTVLTASVVLPWLRLRRVSVRIDRPSPHVALVHFDHGVTPFAGSSVAISRSPLREWHSFATVPTPGRPGFRLAVSRAGDWTAAFIDDLPSKVWIKGIPTAGVANIETLFRRVVYVATGSGIGPCLPHLLAQRVPATLVWATRSPRETYGDALVDEILTALPDTLIWDTSHHGKPDMVRLAYDAYARTGAEAVICISNKKLTWQVVHGMEARGIPAYGAIWDS